MTPRNFVIAGVAVFALFAAWAGYRFVHNPVAETEKVFATELASAKDSNARYHTRADLNYDVLEKAISSRSDLFGEIVAPPPPPPPAPPAPPNMMAKLAAAGIHAKRAGVGDKVRVVTPEKPYGAFFKIGDEVAKGITVSAIAPGDVEFTYIENGVPYKGTLPRER